MYNEIELLTVTRELNANYKPIDECMEHDSETLCKYWREHTIKLSLVNECIEIPRELTENEKKRIINYRHGDPPEYEKPPLLHWY